jgi:hypothetical protein
MCLPAKLHMTTPSRTTLGPPGSCFARLPLAQAGPQWAGGHCHGGAVFTPVQHLSNTQVKVHNMNMATMTFLFCTSVHIHHDVAGGVLPPEQPRV